MAKWWPWGRSRRTGPAAPPGLLHDSPWRKIPPIQRALTDVQTISGTDEFASSLTTAHDPALVSVPGPLFTDGWDRLSILPGLCAPAEMPAKPPLAVVPSKPQTWQRATQLPQQMGWGAPPSVGPVDDSEVVSPAGDGPGFALSPVAAEVVRPSVPLTKPMTEAQDPDEYRRLPTIDEPDYAVSKPQSADIEPADILAPSPLPVSTEIAPPATRTAPKDPPKGQAVPVQRAESTDSPTVQRVRIADSSSAEISVDASQPPASAHQARQAPPELAVVTPRTIDKHTTSLHRSVSADTIAPSHQRPTIQRSADPTPPVLRPASTPPYVDASATDTMPTAPALPVVPPSTARQQRDATDIDSVPMVSPNSVPTVSPVSVSPPPLDEAPTAVVAQRAAAEVAGAATSDDPIPRGRHHIVAAPLDRVPSHMTPRSPETRYAVQRSTVPIVAPKHSEHTTGTASEPHPAPPLSPAPDHTAPPSRVVLLPPLKVTSHGDAIKSDTPHRPARPSTVAHRESMAIFESPQPVSLQRIFEHAVRSTAAKESTERHSRITDYESGSTTVTFAPMTVQRESNAAPPTTSRRPRLRHLV